MSEHKKTPPTEAEIGAAIVRMVTEFSAEEVRAIRDRRFIVTDEDEPPAPRVSAAGVQSRRGATTNPTRQHVIPRQSARPWVFHPAEYHLQVLQHFMPHLDLRYAPERIRSFQPLPGGASGIAVWPKITRLFSSPYADTHAAYHAAVRYIFGLLQHREGISSSASQWVEGATLFADDQTLRRYAAWDGAVPGDVVVQPVWARLASNPQRDVTNLAVLDAFAIGSILLVHADQLSSRDQLLISTTDRLCLDDEFQEGFVNWEWSGSLLLRNSRVSLPQDVDHCLTFFVQQER